MTSSRTSFRRLVAMPAATALLVVSLTACGADSSGGDPDGAPTEQRSTTNSDVEIHDVLPPGFPADDVPLLNDDIVSAGGTEEEGIWIVVIRSTDSPDGARAAAIGLLTAAGYAESEGMAGTGVYTNGTYTVMIRAGQQDGQTILNYSIVTE